MLTSSWYAACHSEKYFCIHVHDYHMVAALELYGCLPISHANNIKEASVIIGANSSSNKCVLFVVRPFIHLGK